ncbi:MAG: hypothetical protein K5866_06465 [Treponema sp.]|nr:hypothetical protein [Treponema sp.]
MNITFSRICAFAAILLEALDLVFFLIRLKKRGIIDKSNFTRAYKFRIVLIYLCAILIPILCLFIEFGKIGDFVLCASSVMGLELINRDLLMPKDQNSKESQESQKSENSEESE